MEFISKSINYLTKSENSFAIIIATSVIGMMINYGFPLFGILIMLLFLLKVISRKLTISKLNVGTILFIVSIGFYLVGVLLNDGVIYNLNKSELINIFSFALILILINDFKQENFPLFFENFSRIVTFFSSLIASFSLIKFYLALKGKYLGFLFIGKVYPIGTSLVADYNMFSFALLICSVASLFLLNKSQKLHSIIYYSLVFILTFSSSLLSGSRRGLILSAFVILFVFILIASLIIKKEYKKILKTYSVIFSLIFLVVAVSPFIINSNSYQFKKIQVRFESLQINKISSSFSHRFERWDYAIELFKERDILEKTIGSGFDYLPKFADKFNVKGAEDYPHNPFLSSALYSGVFGSLVMASLFAWLIFIVIQNHKFLGKYFTILFILSLPYVLISSNSIFSMKFFVSFLLLIISLDSKYTIYLPLRSDYIEKKTIQVNANS